MIVSLHVCGNCDDSNVRLVDTRESVKEDGYEVERDEYECTNCGARYSITSRYPVEDEEEDDDWSAQ